MAGAPPGNPNWLSYVWGQCTYFVAKSLPWVPAGLGNAKDWLANAQKKGFSTSQTPKPGDVVVYGPNALGVAPGTEFGHVAVVQSVQSPTRFTVSEMNVRGLNVVDTRVQNGLKGVLGFIEPPGTYHDPASNPSGLSIPNPLDGIAGAVTGLTGSITGAANTLNPANWLMSLWNNNIKGSLVRVALIIVGLWVLVIGLRMLFESQGSTTVVETPAQSSQPVAQNKPSRNQQTQDSEADASAAEADAPEAAAVA